MEIKMLGARDALWPAVAQYAGDCPWRAGPHLSGMMRKGAFTDWERVFAAFEDGCIAGFCALCKEDCIEGTGLSPWIGFVYVAKRFRGARISQRMIEAAMAYAKTLGFDKVYIASGEKGLYEKYGFTKISDMDDRYGNREQVFYQNI